MAEMDVDEVMGMLRRTLGPIMGDEMMMVGLGDYVAAKVKASAMKSQNFCESCREFEETCNVEEEEVVVSQHVLCLLSNLPAL